MAKKQSNARSNGELRPDGAGSSLPCYVLKLSVENVRCFGPKQTLKLADAEGKPARWTIILGENGTGKTSLLQSFVLLESIDVSSLQNSKVLLPVYPARFWAAGLLYAPSNLYHLDPLGLLSSRSGSGTARCSIQFAQTKELRDKGVANVSNSHWEFDGVSATALSADLPLRFFAYGASRRLRMATLMEQQQDDPVGTLFTETIGLRNVEDWLLRLDYAVKSTGQRQEASRLEQVKHLLVSILPNVEGVRFQTTTGPNPKQWVEFKTFSGWVPLRRLGYGYQTLIAWVLDFVSRMVERYPDSPDPLAEPAIVIVDEIDLHLHPAWQRKLIGFLSERFPNTQFIATAHSPLVVQAAEGANIAVLKRVGDHVEIINDPEEVRGWRVDQILTSDLFGLKSARSPEVEKLFDRKQELLAKAKRTKAQERELAELQEKIDQLPAGDSAAFAKEMGAIHEAIELLKKQSSK